MNRTRYLKDNGYTYDVFMPYVYYFNKDAIMSSPEFAEHKIDEERFLDNVIIRFAPYFNDLLLFFHRAEDGSVFIVDDYYAFIGQNGGNREISFTGFCKHLENKTALTGRVYDYYIKNLTGAPCSEDAGIDVLINALSASGYSDSLKFNLIAFLTNPAVFIDKLILELKNKELLLKKYYEENYNLLLTTQGGFNAQEFIGNYREIYREDAAGDKNTAEGADIFYMISLIDKNLFDMRIIDGSVFAMLGTNYAEAMKTRLHINQAVDMELFGKILSDTNRYGVLQLLLSHNELCTSEIAEYLGLSVKVLYYHLEMMVDSGMLRFRNEGRTMYYYLSGEYFTKINTELNKYTLVNK